MEGPILRRAFPGNRCRKKTKLFWQLLLSSQISLTGSLFVLCAGQQQDDDEATCGEYPSDWEYLFLPGPLSGHEARLLCLNEGGALATAKTEKEAHALHEFRGERRRGYFRQVEIVYLVRQKSGVKVVLYLGGGESCKIGHFCLTFLDSQTKEILN